VQVPLCFVGKGQDHRVLKTINSVDFSFTTPTQATTFPCFFSTRLMSKLDELETDLPD
jgi:hypothetical protein